MIAPGTDTQQNQATTPVGQCLVCSSDAITLLEVVPAELLIACYRRDLGINTADEFHGHTEIPLYHCTSCQLRFFHPQLTGSADFYRQLKQQPWYYPAHKFEYEIATRHINPGQHVLDIGCGDARFAAYVPNNSYQGLEPPNPEHEQNQAGDNQGFENQKIMRQRNHYHPSIKFESLTEHAAKHTEQYDVVCAFQVLEHTTNPVAFINSAKTCLKPGGMLIMGLPNYDSYLKYLVNFVLNAPPHHQSWWQQETLYQLGEVCGLCTIDTLNAPLEPWESCLYWMQWLGQRLPGAHLTGQHFSGDKRWRWLTPLFYMGAKAIDVLPKSLKPKTLRGSTQVWVAKKK